MPPSGRHLHLRLDLQQQEPVMTTHTHTHSRRAELFTNTAASHLGVLVYVGLFSAFFHTLSVRALLFLYAGWGGGGRSQHAVTPQQRWRRPVLTDRQNRWSLTCFAVSPAAREEAEPTHTHTAAIWIFFFSQQHRE